LSSFVWTIFAVSFWDNNLAVSPFYLNFAIVFIFGLLFGYLFWKYDLLTVIIAQFVVIGAMHIVPLITNEVPFYFYSGLASIGLFSIPLLIMVIGFIKNELFQYEPDTTPAHIRRITDRVRMARELEIAQQVQMKLLPKESPQIADFDIAGICIPAREVGGDYYDFIPIGKDKLGIVIGDVSGKGVPAAIYMTLTKGIFQSHAEEDISPKDVLVKVNSLMYRSIERGSFVSIFYAILDITNKKLIYVRAGHNPAIHLKRENSDFALLQSDGIAVGLEKGEIFLDVIREQELLLESGDLIVLYTDGFSEAMNQDRDEYGEDRLIQVVENNKGDTAKNIIDAICTDVNSFVADYAQHDDMTMVVLKVG